MVSGSDEDMGAGGGHAPDIIKIAALPNILPSSITATGSALPSSLSRACFT